MTGRIDPAIAPSVTPFFDEESSTFSYLVVDPAGRECAVIDPVLELDYASGRTSTNGVQRIAAAIEKENLSLQWIIETHVHADHLSGAPWLKAHCGGQIGIGKQIGRVQHTFGELFGERDAFARDGSQFDYLFKDGESYRVGSVPALAMAAPGHTPACMVHVIGDAVFVGDTLFMPDGGTARADFPGGDSGQLYDSIQKILALPSRMRVFVCHDYGPNGRAVAYETTIAAQRRDNVHVGGDVTREQFIQMRDSRDATLSMPRLILPSIQVNMRAGDFPTDWRGEPTLTVPVNRL